MHLRFGSSLFDPSKPEELPAGEHPWMEAVQRFCRFWFSGQSHWEAKTSGSASGQKTILLNREQLEYSARLSLDHFRFHPEDTGFALAIPASAAGGFMLLARAFLADVDVLLLPPDWLRSQSVALPEDKKWFLPLLPNQFSELIRRSNAENFSRRLCGILIGGGGISEKSIAAAEALHCPVWHSYGMTETASHIALRSIHPEKDSPGFLPLQGVEIRVNAGACLEINAGILTNRQWFTSNDLGELLPDGRFLVLGRSDFAVNSGGLKIQPETEKSFLISLFPEDAGPFDLIGIPDEHLGEKLVMVFYNETALVEKIPGILAKIIDREQRKRLPKALYVLPGGPPLLPGGKTNFRFLREKIPSILPVYSFQT